uniref:Uncharacterized protein n=1 Tax=Rhizophora mucronata TaxID=61149 RepID=A0A2P2MXY3_RHIMU
MVVLEDVNLFFGFVAIHGSMRFMFSAAFLSV